MIDGERIHLVRALLRYGVDVDRLLAGIARLRALSEGLPEDPHDLLAEIEAGYRTLKVANEGRRVEILSLEEEVFHQHEGACWHHGAAEREFARQWVCAVCDRVRAAVANGERKGWP